MSIIVTKGKTKSSAVINGITFNNIPVYGTNQVLKVTKNDQPWSVSGEYDGISPIVNAVDIDWNGAEIDNEHILNDTSDLLNYIKSKSDNAKEYVDDKIGDLGIALTIYPFESWNNEQKEIKYGEGTVVVVDQRFGGATVKVLTNESTDPNAENFVGREFNVQNLDTTNPIQLYDGDNPINIWVTVGEPTEILHSVKSYVDNKVDSLNIPSTEGLATETYVNEKINDVIGGAPETLDTLKEIADVLNNDSTMAQLSEAITTKANSADVYTKTEADNKFLTEHQSLQGLATEAYVNEKINDVIGGAPENFDTIKELADVMNDLKVVDTPAQEATYYEEGDELPEGVQVGDEKTPAVEEVSHNMTISEFVNETMQSVNEKPEITLLTKRLSDLEKFVNRYVSLTPEQQQTVANDSTVTETLANATSVTIEEGTIADIVIPETTKSTTITGELDQNSTLELTSPKGVTINNTGAESTNLTVNAPAEGTSTPTVTLKSGTYDTVTVQDASLTVSNGATVQNVVITEETTKSTSINAMFVEGATITSNSEAPITVNNKNAEGQEVSVTLNAPGSTVTLSGGKWTTISGEVSENTLIIKGNARIANLNLTKGNVIVEVPRSEDIATVISGEINLGEGYSITHRIYEITNENSGKLGGVGEMILQEDITRTSSIVSPLAPAYNAVWNLNNHNITLNGTPKSGIYLNQYSSNLELKGTGVIHAEGTYGLWNSATSGKIIVNDGVTVEAQTHALYAEKGTIEVNGGTFKLTNADTADKDTNGNLKFLLNCFDANHTAGKANIIVRGGTFYGFNPAESYGEPNGPVSFVAEGYQSIKDDALSAEYGMNVYKVLPIPVTE